MELSALLGVLIGAIMGLTGAGGGMLAVPALALGMHWTMQQAAPVALIAVAMGAALGTLDGLRHGLVRYKAAALIALCGLPLVYVGQGLAQQLSQPLLQAGLAGVMLLAAARLYRLRHAADGHEPFSPTVGLIHPDTGRFIWSWPTAAALSAMGALTGLVSGLLGVGGGFVVVPLLRHFTHISIQSSVATSLAVIALVGAGGVASAVLHQTAIAWGPAALFSATTLLGMLGGRRLVRTIAPARVQAVFALVLLLVALGLLGKAAMAAMAAMALA